MPGIAGLAGERRTASLRAGGLGREALESEAVGATLGHRRRSDLGVGAQSMNARFLGATDTSPALVSGERWHPESRSGA